MFAGEGRQDRWDEDQKTAVLGIEYGNNHKQQKKEL